MTIEELKDGTSVESSFAVKWKQVFHKKNGEPYLRVVLCDKTGEMPAIAWEYKPSYDHIKVDGVCRIKGTVGKYNDKLQITLSNVEIVKDEDIDPSLFIKVGSVGSDLLSAEIDTIIESVTNEHLKLLAFSFFSEPNFREKFLKHPAARSIHHSYSGGLAEHTLAVCRTCSYLSGQYPLDRDILLTSALLHDVGKLRELKSALAVNYTDEGRLLGHITIGIGMLEDKLKQFSDFPYEIAVQLKHIILSHHGELEFGSPVRPMTIEALALHYADNLDAKLWSFKDWIDSKPDSNDPRWTQYWPAMDRFVFRNNSGSDNS
ncbi:MAG: HD domain-containing protein [Candidatus Schekmanbacteria bacterium]|nr:HD domain-containing protein [Candidatus Schekmanbacteria bacterium]